MTGESEERERSKDVSSSKTKRHDTIFILTKPKKERGMATTFILIRRGRPLVHYFNVRTVFISLVTYNTFLCLMAVLQKKIAFFFLSYTTVLDMHIYLPGGFSSIGSNWHTTDQKAFGSKAGLMLCMTRGVMAYEPQKKFHYHHNEDGMKCYVYERHGLTSVYV